VRRKKKEAGRIFITVRIVGEEATYSIAKADQGGGPIYLFEEWAEKSPLVWHESSPAFSGI
jgi:hypothetical protein